MNPRRFALENLLGQSGEAFNLHRRVLNASKPGGSEKFHSGSAMGREIKERRLRDLEEAEQQLEVVLSRLVPAWAAFGAENYADVVTHLSGAAEPTS